MSRAYRIKVRESLRRVVRGGDHVSTQLELLEVLPREQMAVLLAEELIGLGFEREVNSLVRRDKGVTITVDPDTGTIRLESELSEDVDLKLDRSGWADEDLEGREQAEKALRKQTRRELEVQADEKAKQLQQQATEQLEGILGDLQQELDGVINRVTVEALKRKAAQLGEIKELTEDPESGSMTIVLEV